MPSDSTAQHRGHAGPPEPVAIVGIGALYPGVRGSEEYWRLLREESPAPAVATRGLGEVDVDLARFRIPPAQAGAMARMQILMLEAARQCLADTPVPAERTDVVVGTCFGLDRQHLNALRVEVPRHARALERAAVTAGLDAEHAAHAADELRTTLARPLGGSPHDRVGEMAGTIPARIASAFQLHGRTLALESADATSYVALGQAVDALRGRAADAVLVVTGQLDESRLFSEGLAAKGLLAPESNPFAVDGPGYPLGEGVGALLLKRLATAEHDGDRIYATIRVCALRHRPRPGAFRSPSAPEPRRALAAESLRTAGLSPVAVQYTECVGSGVGAEVRAELAALGELHAEAAPESVALGSVKDRLGHTFANAGVAAVSKVALALHHGELPPHRKTDTPGEPLAGTPLRLPRAPEPWPPGPEGAPRRATVQGASLTGTLCHLVLEEHRRVRRTEPAVAAERAVSAEPPVVANPAVAAEPVAVVALAGRFADAPDAEAFWQYMRAGASRIGPVPAGTLDRELYHAPGALSLTHTYTDQGAPTTVPDVPPPGVPIPPARYAAMDDAQRLALAVGARLLDGRGPLAGRGLVAVGTNLGLSRERRINTALSLRDAEGIVAGLPALRELPPSRRQALIASLRAGIDVPDQSELPMLLDGCLAGGIAALLANEFALDAVPVAVEAACASSLASIDLAVGALRSGGADFAVAGGVELACNTRDMVLCSALGLLSHGRIAPFDADADGFSPGDGCALFLLKRHADALRDGDDVLGVIRGVGASNDARSLIAPDTDGQERAIRRAFEQVDFEPSVVDYVEAHGTGTKVGDRVEVAALARVYGTAARTRPLAIGSAKSFYGHTFAAAGGAGLLRVLLALRERTLPANTNLTTLNPALGLAAVPAVVPTEPAPWRSAPGRPRRAGVSSFGTGGINYHLLVEEQTNGSR